MELQIIITMDMATGQVSLSRNVDNKVMAYGMLAVARDLLSEIGKDNRIIQPSAGDLGLS